jgi:hypothetical protein
MNRVYLKLPLNLGTRAKCHASSSPGPSSLVSQKKEETFFKRTERDLIYNSIKRHFPFLLGVCQSAMSERVSRPVWYSFMSGFTGSFTTSIAKQPALCPALWLASLKTLSHRVKHTVKLQKHGSPPLIKLLMKLFSNSSIGEAELCQTGSRCFTLQQTVRSKRGEIMRRSM